MIITDVKKLHEVPVGEVVTLVMQFKVARIPKDCSCVCKECIFDESGCCQCSALSRPDEKSVRFEKV